VYESPFANSDGAFYGLAPTGEASVAVASRGTNELAMTLFFGEWRGDDLVLVESSVEPGLARILLRATSMASCASEPRHVYAVGSNEDGNSILMLRSHDAGRTWTIFQPMLDGGHHKPLQYVAGHQGNDTVLNSARQIASQCIRGILVWAGITKAYSSALTPTGTIVGGRRNKTSTLIQMFTASVSIRSPTKRLPIVLAGHTLVSC
jgi:hypothetical protein